MIMSRLVTRADGAVFAEAMDFGDAYSTGG
jgi:hypothetical protein